ncbi:MAG TPA: hypothetical protein ENH88_10070 [Pseudoalteromonas prydzensis]|uniref:Uncharacterized protein n=1 Tax=Pseudoalteromonas prydzensis TaxID=182141 RepID=A0A7V1CYR8_9GAMM|nr:hypothetical protein [Pseudoalteromonas prydzensis]
MRCALPSQWGRIIGCGGFYASVFMTFFVFILYPQDTQKKLTPYPQKPVDNFDFFTVSLNYLLCLW